MVVVIGGGLAGLTCAKVLREAGVKDVALVEKAAALGGVVQTSLHNADGDDREGYLLDHGFQVIQDNYQSIIRHVDIPGLKPCYFASEALIWHGGELKLFVNPMREPALAPAMLTGGLLKARDITAFAALGAATLATPDFAFFEPQSQTASLSTWQYLQRYRFSEQVLEGFFRPFFGGVLLDNELQTAAPLFRFYLKKFLLGRCFIPRCGISDLPAQLWESFSDGVQLHLRSSAEALVTEPSAGSPREVRQVLVNCGLAGGSSIPLEKVDAVVLATDDPTAAKLLGSEPLQAHDPQILPQARDYHSVSAVYFSSRASLYPEPCLVLPSGRNRVVRHFCQVTNINPALAPGGRHLISATVLERQDWDDERLFSSCRAEIEEIFPQSCGALQPLKILRVPQAVPHQRPPLNNALKPQKAPAFKNVFLAGHTTTHASLEGVMQSGESAAHLVLEHLKIAHA